MEKYLGQHCGQLVSVSHVAKDVQYVSTMFGLQDWVKFTNFAPRPAAQQKLLRVPKELLQPFDFTPQDDVTLVGTVLWEVLQWGEPPDTGHEDCEELAL